MLQFRQLFDPTSSTYTYLLGDTDAGEAVLIDAVFEHVRRDAALLRELGLRLVATLDTHVHADQLGTLQSGFLRANLEEELGPGVALDHLGKLLAHDV
mgnify:CR=1 FL=1